MRASGQLGQRLVGLDPLAHDELLLAGVGGMHVGRRRSDHPISSRRASLAAGVSQNRSRTPLGAPGSSPGADANQLRVEGTSHPGVGRLRGMCRNIRTLHNFDPPASEEEVHEAALQYVRKISGSTSPSQANAEVFERAVGEVTRATERLLEGLVTSAPPKDREVEAAKRRARYEKRFAAA
jgi:hypothetical protein